MNAVIHPAITNSRHKEYAKHNVHGSDLRGHASNERNVARDREEHDGGRVTARHTVPVDRDQWLWWTRHLKERFEAEHGHHRRYTADHEIQARAVRARYVCVQCYAKADDHEHFFGRNACCQKEHGLLCH